MVGTIASVLSPLLHADFSRAAPNDVVESSLAKARVRMAWDSDGLRLRAGLQSGGWSD